MITMFNIIYRFSPGVVTNNMDNSLITWLLVVVCTPHCIRNPYLIAKIIEVLFVINPSVQVILVYTIQSNSLQLICN